LIKCLNADNVLEKQNKYITKRGKGLGRQLKAAIALISFAALSCDIEYNPQILDGVKQQKEEIEEKSKPVYPITIDGDIQNGSLIADFTSAKEGATIKALAAPDDGYQLKAGSTSLRVDTNNNGDFHDEAHVPFLNTFVMPAHAVQLSAVFQELPKSTEKLATDTEELPTDTAEEADTTSIFNLSLENETLRGGSISISGESAKFGEAITVSVSPLAAYKIRASGSFYIDLYYRADTNGDGDFTDESMISIKSTGENEGSFRMPAANVQVGVQFIRDGNIYYVGAGGSDNNAGASADNAYYSPQKAIDEIALDGQAGCRADNSAPAIIEFSGLLTPQNPNWTVSPGEGECLININGTGGAVIPPIVLRGGTGGAEISAFGQGKHVLVIAGADVTLGANLTLTGTEYSGAGGCVTVGANSTFTMTGGTITGSTTDDSGAGVYIGGASATFLMTGGTISGNIAGASGGGVYNNGAFTMSGGTIYGSNAEVTADANIAPSGAAFYLAGGGSASYVGAYSTEYGPVFGDSIKTTNTALPPAGVVAKWGSDFYPSLGDAIAAANAESALSGVSQNVILYADTTVSQSITVSGRVELQASPGNEWTIKRAASFTNGCLFNVNGGANFKIGQGGAGAIIVDGGAVWAYGSPALSPLTGAGSIESAGSAALVVISGENTTFSLSSGGVLQNNHTVGASTYAAAVQVARGTFNMEGGEIKNCFGTGNGGAVCIGDSDYTGTFNMSGGVISGNRVEGDSGGYGGGVYCYSASGFNMSAGVISGNYAAGKGGGVYCHYSGSIRISGGTIYGSDAGTPLANTAPSGSGAAFFAETGADSQWAAAGYLWGSSEYAVGDTILSSDSTLSSTPLAECGGTGYPSLSSAIAAANGRGGSAASPEVITLNGRAMLNSEIDITGHVALRAPAGTTAEVFRDSRFVGVLFDIQGGSLTIGQASGGGTFIVDGNKSAGVTGDSLVKAGGGDFIMEAGAILQNNKNDGSSSSPPLAYGGAVNVASGTFTMNGGEIKNNYLDASGGGSIAGGGVYVANGATFNLTGGKISGNNMSDGSLGGGGGGIFVATGGTMNMSGGEISGNNSSEGGGLKITGSFAMTGGRIAGNTATYGGGINAENATVTLSGGIIEENAVRDGGGGVEVVRGTLTISGDLVIQKNISGTVNPSYGGGGVRVQLSTVVISGGVIYGEDAGSLANLNMGNSGSAFHNTNGSTVTWGDETPFTGGTTENNTVRGGSPGSIGY